MCNLHVTAKSLKRKSSLWHVPIIPALGVQKKENQEFKANLRYIA